MKRIILCADDYGQNASISQAIIELFQNNRLSATSCMTNSDFWPVHSKWLEPFKNKVDIGLHFNLTHGKPLTKHVGSHFKSLSSLMFKSYMSQLNQTVIEEELNAQLNAFVEKMGQLPNFIDGHQHIQQLPTIRDAIFNVYDKRLRQSGCYIRSVNRSLFVLGAKNQAYFKEIIIQLCGSFAFKKTLIKQQIPHNSSFAGVYNFADAKNYMNIFPNFLNQVNEKGLIMCHPGLPSGPEEDSIANSRYLEFQFFKNDRFLALCQKQQIQLGRFNV